jgi:hypothetical protein
MQFKRFGVALLFGMAGYIVVAIAGYFLILQFSSNRHDREIEAAMTGAFFFGPIGAIAAFILGWATGRRSAKSDEQP